MLYKFVPRMQADSIYDVDLTKLQQLGIKGIITDLDNTLVGTRVPEATPQLIDWLQQLKQHGLSIIILSNNNYARVSRFAKPLEIPFIHNARKPLSFGFQKALQQLKLKPEEAVMAGDQLLTDVFGGNRVGLYTLFVKPITTGDEKLRTRFNRRVEKIVLHTLRKKGLMVNSKEAL